MNVLLRSLILFLSLLASPVHALGMLPLSGSQQFDNATGTFMVGGQMFTYLPGSTTPITVYADVALMVPFSNPIVLGAGARVPPIYAADGTIIRLRIINSAGIVQTDLDQLSFVTAPISTFRRS